MYLILQQHNNSRFTALLVCSKSVCGQRAVPCLDGRPVLAARQTSHIT